MTIQASDFKKVQSDPWPEWVNAEGWRLCGRPGQSLDDLVTEINEAPAPTVETPQLVPDVISDRQFFQQLAVAGMTTDAEALAAVKTGDIPEAMETFIDALPTDQQFAARMVLCGATQFARNHPLVEQFGVANGMTSAQVDDLWIAAAKL
ncbi:hypothetical protein G6K88_07770 [Agrobacterium rhizogenes]|uniref:hypothetical protein n=1 Tax=Rhizobium rhizogenes TaxID=359 RepID=UPI001572F835|nr:hypothetical protein [Rhizobium rhizogenes]NTF80857.1 hypothetical protein [Rhizobium rhizogenes]NTI01915.1 hypothetical protein [Rhizobium rhizogenes]NTI08718.1 hypothetical protein [Rhizobium rhizogenes]